MKTKKFHPERSGEPHIKKPRSKKWLIKNHPPKMTWKNIRPGDIYEDYDLLA